MKFTFIHTADIHLDSPLRGLGAYSQGLADCFREASRTAFVHLVDAAIDREVAFVVIAGDIFDSDWKDYSTGLFFVQQMGRLDRKGIPVYALSGNHDAATEITKNLRYPDNVKMFDTKEPETFIDEATGVALHGQGFHNRWHDKNIAEDYPRPAVGAFNIGVLHTACGSTLHDNYAPCSVEQLCNHGYDYWALGHVHGHAVLSDNPYVVFSGNLQGRHVREAGAKGYCLVEVTENEVTSFNHISCDVARWCDLAVDLELTECSDLDSVLDQATVLLADAVAEADGRPIAFRLRLTGATSLHTVLMRDLPDLRAQIEAVALSVGDKVMLEKLQVRTVDSAMAVASESLEHQDLVLELVNEMDSPEVVSALELEIAGMMKLLKTKLPNKDELLPDEAELAEIIAEAKALVAARLTHKESAGHAN